jgi:tRNA (cytidine(34)-2'-O)-methyltransferase
LEHIVIDVILYEPEIPQNTGNIIRLCANTGARLHLVEPLGFVWDDARVKRAGLDYHEFAEVRRHANYATCLAHLGQPRVFAFSSKAETRFDTPHYAAGDALLFGPETALADAPRSAQSESVERRCRSGVRSVAANRLRLKRVKGNSSKFNWQAPITL